MKLQILETGLGSAPVAGFDQVAGDVDSDNFGAQTARGRAVVPSPQPRSRTRSGGLIPREFTRASPDSRMKAAMAVKSPFSHKALFGFAAAGVMVDLLYHASGRESTGGAEVVRCSDAFDGGYGSQNLGGESPRILYVDDGEDGEYQKEKRHQEAGKGGEADG